MHPDSFLLGQTHQGCTGISDAGQSRFADDAAIMPVQDRTKQGRDRFRKCMLVQFCYHDFLQRHRMLDRL